LHKELAVGALRSVLRQAGVAAEEFLDAFQGRERPRTLDPQLIEKTKRQIRSLVNEIAQLVKSDIRPDEFYSEFLPRVVSALAAEGGVVWALEEQGRLGLAYQMGLQKTRLHDRAEDQKRHERLLNSVLSLPNGEGLLVPPHSGLRDDPERLPAVPLADVRPGRRLLQETEEILRKSFRKAPVLFARG
jgi:hypothetical protein